MLTKLPKHTPPLGLMLADLGNPHPRDIARSLGVGQSTVRRWISDDDAPRPIMLSLFWLTHWGAQWLDADLFNLYRCHAGLSQSLQRELVLMRENYEQAIAAATAVAELQALADSLAKTGTAPELPQAPPMLYVVR